MPENKNCLNIYSHQHAIVVKAKYSINRFIVLFGVLWVWSERKKE